MDLTLLRAFVMVARTGNLTRAAASLHLTQPAVSLRIKHLQETLRLTLFSRTAHGLSLTRDGQALLPLAERALTCAADVERAAAAMRDTVHGQLRIGTILDPEFLRLGGFLKSLVESYPQIETALRHGMSGWVLEQIATGELDVGYYIGRPGNAGDDLFHTVTLTPFNYRVLAPAGWKDRLTGSDWPELAALPWIWTPPTSGHNRLLSSIFGALSVTPVKVAEVDQETSMLDLVKSGIGLALARDAVALREAHAHGLAIADTVMVATELTFVARAERCDEPTIAAAMKLIARQWSIGETNQTSQQGTQAYSR
jgi:DNA-binding transcriptional LysR family regulator